MKITITKRNGKEVDEIIVNEKPIELGHYSIGESINLGELSGQKITSANFKEKYPVKDIEGPNAPEADEFGLSKYHEQKVLLKTNTALKLILKEVLSSLSEGDELRFD